MKKTLFTALFFIITSFSKAQTIRIADSREFLYSDFFVAIVAGVLLGLIFQIVLTALSVAMGITMIGNVKKKYAESQAKLDSERGSNEYTSGNIQDEDDFSGVKFSSAFGIWSLITTTVSLFGACALALNLSFFGTLASNLTIALVIWALFFMILFYLETKIVHTLIGGLITTATAGLKFSAGIVKDLFKKLPANQTEGALEKKIDKIRRESDVVMGNSILSKALDNFLNQGDAVTRIQELNFAGLKNELNRFLNNPKDSLSVVKSRMKKLNDETIIDLVRKNGNVPEKDVPIFTSNIIEIIGELEVKVNMIEHSVNKEVKMTKRKAIVHAEHARKTAASAAWWLVLTVVFSGGAAMLGAYLELIE